MNPMTNVKNIKKLSELELRRNLKTSWHDQYKDSAWVFVGGLPYDLTEGDIICVFSQYGEIVNINLVRDKASGKSKGFCFLCYEDQRSTVLAVDNFNGIKLLGRTLRVDHVNNYKPPKDSEKKDAETRRLQEEGCAPAVHTGATDIKKEKPDIKREKTEERDDCLIIEKTPSVADVNNRIGKEIRTEGKNKKKKKEKRASKEKEKKEKESEKKKKRKARRRNNSSSSSSGDSSESSSDSSSDSSSTESDSSIERARAKKRKHKQMKKKKSKQEESRGEDEMSASSKRRKLEEKIKALEKALSSVRSGRNKQE